MIIKHHTEWVRPRRNRTMAADYIKSCMYRGYRPCKEAEKREHIAGSDYYLCTFEDGSQLIDDEPFLVLIEA